MQLKPISQKVASAINQAKREQSNGSLEPARLDQFVSFIAKQDLVACALPDRVWSDLLRIFQGALLSISILTAIKNITPE